MRVVKRVLLAAAMAAMPLSAVTMTATPAHAVAVQDEADEQEDSRSWIIKAIVVAVIVGGFFYIFFVDDDEDTVSP